MRPIAKRRLDDLMKSTKTRITCVGQKRTPTDSLKSSEPPISAATTAPTGSEDYSSQNIELEIVGQWEDMEKARIQCLIFLDEMVNNFIL